MTNQADLSLKKFPMGPKLRAWFGISEDQYKGYENVTPSPEHLALFSEGFIQSLEEKSPKNADHLVDVLEELVGMNFPLLAIKLVDSFPESFPHGDFRAQLHYGNAAMLVGDLARAEDAFIAAQKLVPEEPAPYVNLTQIYCHDRLFLQARNWCLAGLDADPENARLWELIAWLEQNNSNTPLTTQQVSTRIADLARDKNSWTGTSLACDLANPEDPLKKVGELESFWNSGLRDPMFLIEYTAVLGVAGRYDKIPAIIWQAQADLGSKTPWQLLMHLAQAHLGLGRDQEALQALETLDKYRELPDEALALSRSLMAEIKGQSTQAPQTH